MELTLPKTKSEPKKTEPRKLFIFSHPKVGKTSALAQLPNSLIIDFEDSAEFYESASINIKKLANDNDIPKFDVLNSVVKELQSTDHTYDYIILDTTSEMEEVATDYATRIYKQTPMGKSYKGKNVITDLSRGAGYQYLREAFEKIYAQFEMLPGKCLILSGHVKNSSITKDGKELSARDINLTGKLKTIVSSDMDAVGFMYRNKDSEENILDFKTSEQDLFTGSRLPYLSGKELVISEGQEEEGIKTYWEKVFPSLKN